MALDVKGYSCLSKLNVGIKSDRHEYAIIYKILCSAFGDRQAWLYRNHYDGCNDDEDDDDSDDNDGWTVLRLSGL